MFENAGVEEPQNPNVRVPTPGKEKIPFKGGGCDTRGKKGCKLRVSHQKGAGTILGREDKNLHGIKKKTSRIRVVLAPFERGVAPA